MVLGTHSCGRMGLPYVIRVVAKEMYVLPLLMDQYLAGYKLTFYEDLSIFLIQNIFLKTRRPSTVACYCQIKFSCLIH